MIDHVAEQFRVIDKLMDALFAAPKKPTYTYYSACTDWLGWLDIEDSCATVSVYDAKQIATGNEEDAGTELSRGLPVLHELLRADTDDDVYWWNTCEDRWERVYISKWMGES